MESELKERKAAICQMDKTYSENIQKMGADSAKSQEEYAKLKDRYDRLMEAFKNLQRQNHFLEDKLLSVVTEMTKRKEASDAKCQTMATQLNAAHAKIAELQNSLASGNDDTNSVEEIPKSVVVPMAGGIFPFYQASSSSTPDLVGLERRAKAGASSTKQVYSPVVAIQTFPPTLMCNAVSFSPTCEKEEHNRERSDSIGWSCVSGGNDKLASSPPPTDCVLNDTAAFDLKTHRTTQGSVFTV